MNGARLLARLSVPARWYLGVLFVSASLHKIAEPGSFAVDIATYGLLPLHLVNMMAIVLPWTELMAGSMLLIGWRVRPAALLTALMMTVFIVALLIALARGLDMSCGCFASQGAEEDPISWLTVGRDLVWLGLTLLVLVGDAGLLGVDHWVDGRKK